jgi:calcineurin-like phosphoesterase family protein
MRWFTSDLHIFHRNILQFCRPEFKTLDEMHKYIINTWNQHVKPSDVVYNLGDLAFQVGSMKGEINAILSALNGKHILFKGNHDDDKKISNFTNISEYFKTMDIEIHGVKFRMAHFPYKHAMPEKDKIERPECFTPDSEFKLIHGHVHESFATRKDCLNVGWDIWKRPITEDEVWKVFEDTKGFTIPLDKALNL